MLKKMKKKLYKITVNNFSDITLEKFDYQGKVLLKVNKSGDRFLKTIYRYDNLDLLFMVVDSDGYKEEYNYDRNGNLIEKSDSRGYFEIFKYDENNHMTYSNNSNDEEFWYKYDERGNETYFKNKYGLERFTTYEYDDLGNIIFINTEGNSVWRKYDPNGHLIYVKRESDQHFSEYIAEYDDNKLMYVKDGAREIWYEYEDDKLVFSKDSDGNDARYEYDKNGNNIFSKDFYGSIEVQLFDEFNNKIFYRDDDISYWKKFDKNKNEIYSYDECGREIYRTYNENNDVIVEDGDNKRWFNYIYYEDLNSISIDTLLYLEQFGSDVVIK